MRPAAAINNELETIALAQFEQALEHLDETETQTYRVASQNYPNLVRSEANPMWFLAYSDFNYSAACKRMVAYWKIRLEIYGADRVYRPVLDLSGKEALSPTAVELLNTGVMRVLRCDRHNRLVLFLDKKRLKPKTISKIGATKAHEREMIFHLLLRIATLESSRMFGFSVVHLISEAKPKIRPDMQEWFLTIVKDGLPIHWRGAFVLCAPPSPKKVAAYRDFKEFLWQVMTRTVHIVKDRSIELIDPSATKQQIAEALVRGGMRQEYLPPQAGGQWCCERSKKWLLELERQRRVIVFKEGAHSDEPSPLDLLASVTVAVSELPLKDVKS